MNTADFDGISEEQTKLLKQLVGIYITQNYKPEFAGIVNSTGEFFVRAFAQDRGQSDIIFNASETDLLALSDDEYVTLFKAFDHRESENNQSSVSGDQASYKFSLKSKAKEKATISLKKYESKTAPIFNPENAPETTKIVIALVGLVGVIATVVATVWAATGPIELAAKLTSTAGALSWTATSPKSVSISKTPSLIVTGTPTELASNTPASISSLTFTPSLPHTIIVSTTKTQTLKPVFTKTPTPIFTKSPTPTTASTFTPDPFPTISGLPTFTPYPTSSNSISPNNKNNLIQLAWWKTNSDVYSLAISPNGEWIASGEQNGKVTLRSASTGTILRSLSYGSTVRDVSFSQDGKWLAAAGNGKVITIWRTDTWTTPITITGHTSVISSLSFSPDGTLLASGGYDDKTVRLWKVGTWESDQVIYCPKEVNVVAFSPDSRLMAVGVNDGLVRVWDLNGAFQYMLEDIAGSKEAIISLAFSPNGQLLVSGTRDEQHPFQVWDLINRELEQGIGGPYQGTTVVFSPDGSLLVTGDNRNTLRIWRTSNITLLRFITNYHQDVITSVIFSADGKLMITGSKDRTIRIWGIK